MFVMFCSVLSSSLTIGAQDLYLMRFDGPLEDLKFSPSEVDDLKFVPMEELRDVYTAEVRTSRKLRKIRMQ